MSGGILVTNNSNIVFHKSDTKLNDNTALNDGGALYIEEKSTVTFEGNSTVAINDNLAEFGAALYIVKNSSATFKGNTTITVSNNQATDGGAFYISGSSGVNFEGNSILQINNNKAKNGRAFYLEYNSKIKFHGNSKQTINNNQATFSGGAIHIFNNSVVTFEGTTTAVINGNQATVIGGAITGFSNARITFEGNITVTINNNQANVGGALGISNNSVVTSKGSFRSTITINNNKANSGGGIYMLSNSGVTFERNSTVKINYNEATYGGALYASVNCNITIKGKSTVIINDNQAAEDGGAFYMDNSDVTFEQSSTVTINNNKAGNYGGAFCFWYYCDLTCRESAKVIFYNNSAIFDGGAIYARDDFTVTIEGNSTTIFDSNEALGDGGALYTSVNCIFTFQDNSIVNFNNNRATQYGGALYFRRNCDVFFKDNTHVVFYNNIARIDGGALYAWNRCYITAKGNCITIYNNNKALGDGGAMYIYVDSDITFQENSTTKFNDNIATYFGGALGSKSNINFKKNCNVMFYDNKASQGGAIFTACDTVFKDNSIVQFVNNSATTLGGALHASDVKFEGSTTVTYKGNEAEINGGALYSINSIVTIKENSTVKFITNSAENGGALFISVSTLLISELSSVIFDQNIAGQDGGAIYFNDQVNAIFKNSSIITFTYNIADNHGGAVYSKITQDKKYFNISEFEFSNNVARVAGNLLYIDIAESCNGSCLTERMSGISPSDKDISTSPNLLKLYFPAYCISNDSAGCEQYYINNVMLGQEITIHTCLLDYYHKPAEVTQFKIYGESDQFYSTDGSGYTSVSCNHTIDGISIIGNKSISNSPLNYSIIFTSYTTGKSVRKIVSVNLTVGLSPCHPGFQYQRESQKCECYNTSGVVYCSDSSSAIKRGYWFGIVNEISTVTFCPINYCNFTCCKTTNGYYDLSPVRINQCRWHRSGTACGSCEEGYTLSFDSPECINVNECITGQTLLITALTVLYWFTIIIAVFIIMYCQVGIGYFYAITYYYSIVDILLSQHTDISNALNCTVKIFSSIAKITPQFLGRLCLLENMSGIDQQFIHYIHPLAVSVILLVICWSARNSKRLSMFISKGIIRAICFLLLLSYTSMATTSLLLMRSLTFIDVDNVYTYLSPDIRYFCGRHLAYGIIAIIFALLIVIGLPLLLLLEPFLNSKVNFVRIKPLLDQFQGCYKDKYRWFAAYYMICRLIIISIIICNLSEAFISRYLLITVSTVMALIHLIVRPYVDNVLNMCDGVILQLLILVTALPLFEYFDAFDSTLVVGIAFILVILPSVQFIVMNIFTSKQILKVITKKTIRYLSSQNFPNADVSINSVISSPSTTFTNLTIDDNMRRNAIICEM